MCHINETEIERRLKALKVNESMGMDCVHLMVLRECSVAFTKPLVLNPLPCVTYAELNSEYLEAYSYKFHLQKRQ